MYFPSVPGRTIKGCCCLVIMWEFGPFQTNMHAKNNTNTPPVEVYVRAHPIYLGQELLLLSDKVGMGLSFILLWLPMADVSSGSWRCIRSSPCFLKEQCCNVLKGMEMVSSNVIRLSLFHYILYISESGIALICFYFCQLLGDSNYNLGSIASNGNLFRNSNLAVSDSTEWVLIKWGLSRDFWGSCPKFSCAAN